MCAARLAGGSRKENRPSRPFASHCGPVTRRRGRARCSRPPALGGPRERARPQVFVSLPIGRGGAREATVSPRLAAPGEGACRPRHPRTAIGAGAEGGVPRSGNNTGAPLAAPFTPPPCSPSSGSDCATISAHKARADTRQRPDPLTPAWARPLSPLQLWVPTSHHGHHHGAAALPGSDLGRHRRPPAAALRSSPAPPARGQQL